MRIRIEGISHRGRVRDHNEDAFGWRGLAVQTDDGPALVTELEVTRPVTIVVCDGMGGHAGGDRASAAATRLIGSDSVVGSTADHHDAAVRLRAAIRETSDALDALPTGAGEGATPGCTVVGTTVFPDGSALIFNVGDSRAYTLDDGILSRLTEDHRREGSNVLTQALGGGARIALEPSFYSLRLGATPGIVVCTDGVDDYVDQATVESAMAEDSPDLPLRLRNHALAGGGGDNVTVLQISLVPEPVEPETDASEPGPENDPAEPEPESEANTGDHLPTTPTTEYDDV